MTTEKFYAYLDLFDDTMQFDRKMKSLLESSGTFSPEYNRIFFWCRDFEIKCLRRAIDSLIQEKYKPDQARAPSGSSNGGQWVDQGGGGGGGTGTGSLRISSGDGHRRFDSGKPSKNPSLHDLTDLHPAAKTPKPPIPKRRDGTMTVSKADWDTYHDHIHKGPKLSQTQQEAHAQIFAAEGGYTQHAEGSAVAGILEKTLGIAKTNPALKDKLKGIHMPRDLAKKPELVPHIYKDILDRGLDQVGGSAALDKVGNKYAAISMADTVFREGKNGAGKIMKEAVNNILHAQGKPLLDITSEAGKPIVIGPKIFGAYSHLAKNPATLGLLLDSVSDVRQQHGKNLRGASEPLRADYFRFEKERNE